MKRKILISWTTWSSGIVTNAIDSAKLLWGHDGTQEVPDKTFDRFKEYVTTILVNYVNLGLHIIGRWEKTENDHYPEFVYIVNRNLVRIKPQLMQLQETLSSVDTYERGSNDRDIITSANGSTNLSSSTNKNKNSSGNHNGASRAAGENSPITAEPINSSPGDSAQWNISNPNMKSGSQYDNHFQNADAETEQKADAETYSDYNSSSIDDSYSKHIPEIEKDILKFNAYEYNTYIFAERFIRSLTEEFNTVY